MSSSYVVDGAELSCTMGEKTGKLKVMPPHKIKMNGADRANTGDCKSVTNLQSFGLCKTTGIPCVPTCPTWVSGKSDVLVEGMPALLSKSIAMCSVGMGVISIINDG